MNRKRRGRSEGSIFQRDDGLWVASYSAGYDVNGKRRRRTVYGSTKQEAQEKLRQLQAEGPAIIEDLTTGEYLTRWLRIVQPTVQPNTYGPYERHCRLHLIPRLGSVLLAKLSVLHVRELYAEMGRAKVSAAMQRKAGTTLTIALNQAVRDSVILGNPSLGIKKPLAEKTEIQPLTPEQVGQFLAAAKSDRFFAFYVLSLDSGARPGELFALEWPDVDLEAGRVSITKSLEQIGDKQRIKEAKTKRARRRIDLSAQTVAALSDHRRRMLAEGFIGSPVFCNTIGGHVRISDFHKSSFKPILTRAELPPIRLYDLRHTSATLLLLADESAKVVSERLGHATITLTLDTYAHVLPTMQKRAAQTMNRILGNAVAGANG